MRKKLLYLITLLLPPLLAVAQSNADLQKALPSDWGGWQNLTYGVADSVLWDSHPKPLQVQMAGSYVHVAWMEDFENANTLLPDYDSLPGVARVTGPEAWHSVNSFWSGKVELPPDTLDFYMTTSDEFDFYKGTNGVYCLLEMDYNCNDTFFVGVKYYHDYYLESLPLVKVTPTDKTHDKPQRWNKIYINIGPYMNKNQSASYFKIYFTSDLTTGVDVAYNHFYHPASEPRYYYFDNLKLLYRNLN